MLPNRINKFEIDYILCSHHYVLQDVSVIGRKGFSTGSDHRPLRMRSVIKTKLEKRALMASSKLLKLTTIAKIPMDTSIPTTNSQSCSNRLEIECYNDAKGLL